MAEYFQRFKFWGDYQLREVFSHELKLALKNFSDYTIVPIPISKDRRKTRGFNQVTALLDAARIPYQNILEKDEREAQSHLSRLERLKREQPFRIKQSTKVPNKILLVDDIYTTGATIYQAKQIIMKEGTEKIKTFSLAR
ncbi:ComF family protein [Streptococcus sp. DD13]|uniref:ComF family protein n=1 Tax=Streptococcus sp. DD13 TaxID=1777881 RepID=UPI00079A039F|nr:hypothetical protein [Streptococcus sp. DD13]KXT77454.1 Competence protein F-like protein, phosphoribosyltransferase domain [Streptococcus sp. DD13]